MSNPIDFDKKDNKTFIDPESLKKMREIEQHSSFPIFMLGLQQFLQAEECGTVTRNGKKEKCLVFSFWSNKDGKKKDIQIEDFLQNQPVFKVGMTLEYAKRFRENLDLHIKCTEEKEENTEEIIKEFTDIKKKVLEIGQKVLVFNGDLNNKDIEVQVDKDKEGKLGYKIPNLIGEATFVYFELKEDGTTFPLCQTLESEEKEEKE